MIRSTRPLWERARSRSRLCAVGVILTALVASQLGLGSMETAPASAAAASSGSPIVRVSGKNLVNGSGTPIRLIGVDQAGAESVCVAGKGFGVPQASAASAVIATMKSWKVNAVRLPLNEDCWLGINLPKPQFGGAPYRSAIVNYVNELNAAGLAVILDLHWSAPGSQLATGGEVMADEDHSPSFWTSVATSFKGHRGVIFDLYNEPRDIPFSCLVDGGCVEHGWKVAGYNQLISDVRHAGATNVIMVAGNDFAANPTGFSKIWPSDPLRQVAISVHVYNFNGAKKPATWALWVHMGLVAKVPFVTGELGERDCTAKFIDSYMSWADAYRVSYLAWTFNSGPCDGPYLLSPNGNPNVYGAGYKAHLARLVPSSVGVRASSWVAMTVLSGGPPSRVGAAGFGAR